jgi:hypothetical protein
LRIQKVTWVKKNGSNSWKNQHQCKKEHEQSTDHHFSVTSLVNRSETKSRMGAELVKDFKISESTGVCF